MAAEAFIRSVSTDPESETLARAVPSRRVPRGDLRDSRVAPWRGAAMMTAAICSTLTACSASSPTTSLRTADITATVEVKSYAETSGVSITAMFRKGNADVRLAASDELVATAGSAQIALTEDSTLGVPRYIGMLPDAVRAPGTKVTVTLKRGSGYRSAPLSIATLPGGVRIASFDDGRTFSRSGDDIQVGVASVTNAAPKKLTWDGACIESGSMDVDVESGPVTITRGTLKSVSPSAASSSAPPTECQVTLTLVRSIAGQLDSGYKGGSISGEAMSIRYFTSKP